MVILEQGAQKMIKRSIQQRKMLKRTGARSKKNILEQEEK